MMAVVWDLLHIAFWVIIFSVLVRINLVGQRKIGREGEDDDVRARCVRPGTHLTRNCVEPAPPISARTKELEAAVKPTLAELVATAERIVIAGAHPLAGDPHQAQVVHNRPDPTWHPAQWEVVPVTGVPDPTVITTHQMIEVTAIGDRERSWVPAAPSRVLPNHIRNPLLCLREERVKLWGQAKRLATMSQYRAFTHYEIQEWDMLNAMLDDIDKRIAVYQRAADRWSG